MLNGLNVMLLDFHCKIETFNWAQVTTILDVGGGCLVVCVFPTASSKRVNDFWIHPPHTPRHPDKQMEPQSEPSLMHHGEDIRNTYPVLLMWSIQSIRPWI